MNRRASQNKAPGRGRGDQMVTRPPSFLAAIKLTKKIRYNDVGTTTTFNITRGNILNVFLNGTTSSTCGRLLAAVRLTRLELWCTLTPGNAYASFSVEWLSNYGPSIEISDTTVSVSLPGHLITSPPTNSLCSFWSLTGVSEGEVLAKLVLPSSSNGTTVIDATFECVFMDDETPVSVSLSQTVTPNQFYMGYLDGQGSSSEVQPVSYTNIK